MYKENIAKKLIRKIKPVRRMVTAGAILFLILTAALSACGMSESSELANESTASGDADTLSKIQEEGKIVIAMEGTTMMKAISSGLMWKWEKA